MRLVLPIVTLAVGAIVGVLAAASGTQPGAPPAPGVLALVQANVVDVRDGQIVRNATVVVRGPAIESIGAGPAPSGAEVLDLGGAYLLPGLIDAHTHISTLRALQIALESGVTTARSAGVSNFVDVGMRELVRKGAIPGPEILAAGYHVRPTLADAAFLDEPGLSPFMKAGVRNVDAIRQVVRVNVSHGVDWIKILATERAGTPDTDPRLQVYSEPELRAAVEEAAAKGLPVQAHAHGDEGARAAVRAGVRSIEHGTYLSDGTLRAMREHGTFFDPTYATVIDLVEPGGDYDTAALQLRGRHMLPRLADTVRRAHRMGIRIVTGADTGYGEASVTRISHEVAALVELGMTPLEALRAATVVPAEMLRLEKRIGALAPGLEADAIAVEGNPLQDPRALDDVRFVMSNGKVVRRP